MHEVHLTAGIDVSKATLELGLSGKRKPHRRTFNNEPADHEQLVEYLQQLGVDLVVVESTGGYERALVRRLQKADVPIAIAQPARIRYHARSRGILAKSDRIDADLIADYGEQVRPAPVAAKSATARELRALCERRDQLVGDRSREKNRLEACDSQWVADQLRQAIAQYDGQVREIEKRIKATIAKDPWFAHLHRQLQTVTGIGPVTATVLVTYLPEIGRINRQRAASLAGMAPYDRDSGKLRGKRTIFGGRARLRQAMYVAAVTAVRYPTPQRVLYERLVEAGKPKKVALIACARKLLIYVNSMANGLRDESEHRQPVH